MVWGIVGFLLFFGILLAWGVGLQIHTALWARPGYQLPEPKEKPEVEKEPAKE